jgi:hypothetical protein
MNYIIDSYSAKNKEEKRKLADLDSLIKSLKNAIKSNLKDEKDDKKKVNLFYAGLIQLVEKLLNNFITITEETKDKEDIKNISSVVKNIEQVVINQDLKQHKPRLEKIKAKLV